MHRRIVQTGTGQEGASLWLLATDSLAAEKFSNRARVDVFPAQLSL
jgi:hypothetical protein